MKIQKAIEMLTDSYATQRLLSDNPHSQALKLGIQALIRVSNDRSNPGAYKDLPLPGETE